MTIHFTPRSHLNAYTFDLLQRDQRSYHPLGTIMYTSKAFISYRRSKQHVRERSFAHQSCVHSFVVSISTHSSLPMHTKIALKWPARNSQKQSDNYMNQVMIKATIVDLPPTAYITHNESMNPAERKLKNRNKL